MQTRTHHYSTVNARIRSGACVLMASALMSCGGGGGSNTITAPPVTGCSVVEQNQFVIDLMQDIYYWVDEIPANINAADFASPEETLQAMLFTGLDRFSGLRDREANDVFFSDSQFIGIGITLKFEDGDRVLLAQVFGDGPAAAVGLDRGYELLQINGRAVSDIIGSGDSVSAAFGADEVGVNVTVRYRDLAGNIADASFAKALVTIETVSAANVINVNGQATGYLHFRNFVEPSFAALDSAFAEFQAASVTQLILDVRYNGGGLVSVAEFLSGLIGGTVTDGQILAKRSHNTQNAGRNIITSFRDEARALDLTRLVVITAGGTASASELVINSLRPFLDIQLVGEQSFGKPVGSYGFDFCDKTALPIAFNNLNAIDEGNYFDGFPVDCAALDDLSQPLGSEQEGMLAEAIAVLGTGACSAATASAKAQQHRHYEKHRAMRREQSEFRQLLHAY